MERSSESIYSYWNKFKKDIFDLVPNTNTRPTKKPVRVKRPADDPLEGTFIHFQQFPKLRQKVKVNVESRLHLFYFSLQNPGR